MTLQLQAFTHATIVHYLRAVVHNQMDRTMCSCKYMMNCKSPSRESWCISNCNKKMLTLDIRKKPRALRDVHQVFLWCRRIKELIDSLASESVPQVIL